MGTDFASQTGQDFADSPPPGSSPTDRARYFATVALRLLMVTALASFWVVAGVSVMEMLR